MSHTEITPGMTQDEYFAQAEKDLSSQDQTLEHVDHKPERQAVFGISGGVIGNSLQVGAITPVGEAVLKLEFRGRKRQ